MANPKGFAVILQPNAPTELLQLLKPYSKVTGPYFFVFSWIFEESVHFATLALLRKGKKKPWKVHVPISYILAVAEVSDSNNPIGFV